MMGNIEVSVVSMGALDKVIKELIAAEVDDAHSACGVTLEDLLKVEGGVFRIINSGSEDGGFLSTRGGKGVTKDAETRRREGVKLT